MKKEKPEFFGIGKDDFIKFLSSATPDEVNRFVLEKGKPRKLIEPMIFFDKKEETKGE